MLPHTTKHHRSKQARTGIKIQIRNLEINVIAAFMTTHSGCNNIVKFYPTNKICFINITHSKRDALLDVETVVFIFICNTLCVKACES